MAELAPQMNPALHRRRQQVRQYTRFVRLMIRAGTPDGLPRPTITPAEVKSRLARHIGADHGEN